MPEAAFTCPECGLSQDLHNAETLDLDDDSFSSPGSPILSIGQVVADRWRLEEILGRGGMGIVYGATDLRRDTPAALKVLTAPPGAKKEFGQRFQREVSLLARLTHPSLPRFLGSGSAGEDLYVVTERIQGRNLAEILADEGAQSLDRAVQWGTQLARALAAAHDIGIVHRDLKPHNVMLSTSGRIYLIDFGVARTVTGDVSTLTRTGMLVGTPEYMSPEQIEGKRIDARSDIYSFGVVLYEILTAVRPFDGDTPLSVARKHLQEQPPRLRDSRPDAPAWLERVVARCLMKDPGQRLDSASYIAELLEQPRLRAPQERRLPCGDRVVLDDDGQTEWALQVLSTSPWDEWAPGMALHFQGRFYELQEIMGPSDETTRWCYRFVPWPEARVFRGLIDYDKLSEERSSKKSLGDRLRGLFRG